jgi:hypothetical protein
MHIKTLLIFLLTILLHLTACTENRVIIMSKDYCPNYGTTMWDSAQGCAVVTQNEIKDFENFFNNFLSTTEGEESLKSKWKGYYRQYTGRYSSDKQKLLYLNAFCGSFGETNKELENKEISVDGGGDCYFRVIFNTEKQKIEVFMVNADL